MGQLSSVMGQYGPERLLVEVMKLASLGVVRSVACYLQQAYLWEAALRAVCKIRVDVFGKLLHRDLGFFEGRGGIPTGEVAHRITAEAKDVADTVFALLNVSTSSLNNTVCGRYSPVIPISSNHIGYLVCRDSHIRDHP